MSGRVWTFFEINLILKRGSEKNRRIWRLRGIKKGKRKSGPVLRQPRAHMWPGFAYVASLQGKGPSKRKQQRSCSWGREAVACLPRPLYGKQWIQWRTGLWQPNRRVAAAQRGLCFCTFTYPLCQYLPHREARKFPFLLYWDDGPSIP